MGHKMSITYKWDICSLSTTTFGNHSQVVTRVNWRLIGEDGNVSSYVDGVANIEYKESASFSQYKDLTKDTIVEWLTSTIGEEAIEKYKTHIQLELAQLLTAESTLPWAVE